MPCDTRDRELLRQQEEAAEEVAQLILDGVVKVQRNLRGVVSLTNMGKTKARAIKMQDGCVLSGIMRNPRLAAMVNYVTSTTEKARVADSVAQHELSHRRGK